MNALTIASVGFCVYLLLVIRRMQHRRTEHVLLGLTALALLAFCAAAYVVYNTQHIELLRVLIPMCTVTMFMFFPLQLHFACALFRDRSLPPIAVAAIYSPPAVLAVVNFFVPLTLVPVALDGWVVLRPAAGEALTVVWFSYVTASWCIIVSLFMRYSRRVGANRERRHRMLVVLASMGPLILLGVEYHLPLLVPNWSIPSQTPVLLTVWLGAMLLAVRRYGPLRATPVLLAERILDSIEDMVLLYDMSGARVYANRKATSILGVPGATRPAAPDPFAHHVRHLLADAAQWRPGEPERQFRITLPTCDKRSGLPLTASVRVRPAFDAFGDPLGLLLSATLLPQLTDVLDAYRLTTREAEVLEYLSCGMSIGRTASALSITERTVKSHITHIYQKTGARNRIELVNMIGVPGAG